jgi:hypothetical protein
MIHPAASELSLAKHFRGIDARREARRKPAGERGFRSPRALRLLPHSSGYVQVKSSETSRSIRCEIERPAIRRDVRLQVVDSAVYWRAEVDRR